MILYDKYSNFLGMSSTMLNFLGFEDLEEFKAIYKDVADLFVEKRGYIYKFKNFSWIEYALHSGTPNKKVLITLKNSQVIESEIKIKEIYLINPIGESDKFYSIEFINSFFNNEPKIQTPNTSLEEIEAKNILQESKEKYKEEETPAFKEPIASLNFNEEEEKEKEEPISLDTFEKEEKEEKEEDNVLLQNEEESFEIKPLIEDTQEENIDIFKEEQAQNEFENINFEEESELSNLKLENEEIFKEDEKEKEEIDFFSLKKEEEEKEDIQKLSIDIFKEEEEEKEEKEKPISLDIFEKENKNPFKTLEMEEKETPFKIEESKEETQKEEKEEIFTSKESKKENSFIELGAPSLKKDENSNKEKFFSELLSKEKKEEKEEKDSFQEKFLEVLKPKRKEEKNKNFGKKFKLKKELEKSQKEISIKENFEDLGISTDEEKELIEDFIADMQKNISLMKKYIVNKNYTKIADILNIVKSAANILNIKSISNKAEKMQEVLKEDHIENFEKELEKLYEDIEELRFSLEKIKI